MDMHCEEARILISARMDDQLGPGEDAGLAAHLRQCSVCARWEERARGLRRAGLRAVESHRVHAIGGLPRGFHRHKAVRLMLAWVGVLLVAWNVPEMVSAGTQVSVHLARHQGAFGVGLGLVFLIVAWRPDRAYGVVPFAAIFTVSLSVTALIDVVNGVSTLVRESRHMVELAGLGFLWMLGASAGPGGGGSPRWGRAGGG